MTRIAFEGASFELDDRRVRELYRQFPQEVAVQLRDAFGAMGGSHRRAVGQRLAGKPIRKLVAATGRSRNPSFFYQTFPKQVGKKAGEGFQFKRFGLDEIRLEIFSTSEVTALHETGGTIRPRRGQFLAIPIRGATGDGFRFVRGKLVGGGARRIKPTPGALRRRGYRVFRRGSLLYAARQLKSGRFSKRARSVFLLRRSVTIRARLGVISTWNSLAADRTRRIDRALERAIAGANRRASRVAA